MTLLTRHAAFRIRVWGSRLRNQGAPGNVNVNPVYVYVWGWRVRVHGVGFRVQVNVSVHCVSFYVEELLPT